MALSKVKIYNMALVLVGDKMITSPTEDSKEVDLCNLYYEPATQDVLEDHPWDGFIKRADLNRETATPVNEFDYQFTLPNDCIRVLNIPDYPDVPYRIEQNKLLTDEETASIRYIAFIDDPTLLRPKLAKAVAARLAADICYALSDNASLANLLEQKAELHLKRAKWADAEASTEPDQENTDWVDAGVV